MANVGRLTGDIIPETQAVNEAIRNRLLVYLGQRYLHTEYGTLLYEYIGDNIDGEVIQNISADIGIALQPDRQWYKIDRINTRIDQFNPLKINVLLNWSLIENTDINGSTEVVIA